MIGRMYVTAIGSQAQTAAKTLIEIAAPADSVVLIERMRIAQTSFDTSENMGAKVERITTTGTGTANTPKPLQDGDAAFGGTVKTNLTVEPTYNGDVVDEDGFNALSGYLWTPSSDDEIIVLSPSQLAAMMLDVAPSASMNFSYNAKFREIGG